MGPHGDRGAFSLWELLIVMSVMGVLVAVVGPAFFGFGSSLSLTQTGDQLVSLLANARQEAIAGNRSLEVRFYDLSTEADDTLVKTVQLVDHMDDGEFIGNRDQFDELAVRGRNIYQLPTGYGISRNPRFSSFFEPGDTGMLIRGKAGAALPMDPEAQFIGFRFLPDGSTELPVRQWFFTVVAEAGLDESELPKNYYLVQIDPAMGRVRVFRPERGTGAGGESGE